MKKIKTLAALGLSITMLAGATACKNGGGNNAYSDYYTFDTSSITSELLYGSEMKIDPVVKNLGTVVDANYNVTVSLDGKDVTSSVYNKETKIFAPAQQSDAIGTYTFNLTIVDDEGKNVLDENGKAFSTSFNVDYCIMNFVPKANAGSGVIVNNDDPLSPSITFDESYAAGAASAKRDSGQYRLTGVSFSGDYEIVYRINANAISANEETRFFFGVDRTDENKRDDNIALNVNDGRLSAWFFQDYGQAGGDDWSGTGWTNTSKSVQNNVMDGKDHLIGFTRVISSTGNAYYVVTWDGEYFTTLNVRGNYTDTVGGVWVESVNVEGGIEVASYRSLAPDTGSPAVVLNYEDVGVGSEVNLNEGIIVMDEVYNASSNIAWSVKDADGEAVSVTGGKVVLDEGGVYTVTATVTDLKGNSTTTSTKLSVYSDFTVTNVGLDRFYKAGDEITANLKFSSDDEELIKATQAKLIKGDVEAEGAVTGNATDGFKFTPSEAGIYTLRVSTVSVGRTITKNFEFTVSGANATDIDMSRNTAVARPNVAMMIYGEGAETLKVYKGDTLFGATDVTAAIADRYTTETLENNVSYDYFRPTEAGTYYVVAQKGTGDSATLRANKITVSANVLEIYDDEELDLGNGNLDKTVWGNDEMIFLNQGDADYETSKVVYNNTVLATGDFAIEFNVTDLSFRGANKKLFFSILLGGWRDFFIEGKLNADKPEGSEFWGYGSNFPGTSWLEYQWKSTWQAPTTDAYIPDDSEGYNRDEHDGKPEFAFREGDEYAQYLTGTHTYRVEFRMTAEGVYTVYFYIDGRPEATHRDVNMGGSSLTCLVINSQSMSGVMHDLKVIDDIETEQAD